VRQKLRKTYLGRHLQQTQPLNPCWRGQETCNRFFQLHEYVWFRAWFPLPSPHVYSQWQQLRLQWKLKIADMSQPINASVFASSLTVNRRAKITSTDWIKPHINSIMMIICYFVIIFFKWSSSGFASKRHWTYTRTKDKQSPLQSSCLGKNTSVGFDQLLQLF